MFDKLDKLYHFLDNESLFEQSFALIDLMIKLGTTTEEQKVPGTWVKMNDLDSKIRYDILSLEAIIRKKTQDTGLLTPYLSPAHRPTRRYAYLALLPDMPVDLINTYDQKSLEVMSLQALMNIVDEYALELFESNVAISERNKHGESSNTTWLQNLILQTCGVKLENEIISRRLRMLHQYEFDSTEYIREIAEENPEMTGAEIINEFRTRYPGFNYIAASLPRVLNIIKDVKSKRRLRIFDDLNRIMILKREMVHNQEIGKMRAIIDATKELNQIGYRIEDSTLRNLLNASLEVEPNKFAGKKWKEAFEEWKVLNSQNNTG